MGDTIFYDKLRDFRKEKGYTIREVASRSGVSASYISQLENGQRGIPSPDVLLKLSEGLNISYSRLMEEAGYLQSLPELDADSRETIDLRRLLRDFELEFDGIRLTADERAWLDRMIEAALTHPNRSRKRKS